MIEQRRLTGYEIDTLLIEAPDSEKRNLIKVLKELKMSGYEFFDKYAIDHFGLISNERPIYMVALVKNDEGKNEMWTVVNSGVKEMVSLCKYCKRGLKGWIEKYKVIYATMEKCSPQNARWTEWLGFKKIAEDEKVISYKIGEN